MSMNLTFFSTSFDISSVIIHLWLISTEGALRRPMPSLMMIVWSPVLHSFLIDDHVLFFFNFYIINSCLFGNDMSSRETGGWLPVVIISKILINDSHYYWLSSSSSWIIIIIIKGERWLAAWRREHIVLQEQRGCWRRLNNLQQMEKI